MIDWGFIPKNKFYMAACFYINTRVIKRGIFMVDGINNVFKNGQKIELKNRGVNSGITYELKSVFDELAKRGVLKDKDGKGLSKKDALNLYNALNKIHKETNRATNYTKMQVGQNFEYTADEMKQLAKAAGYDIVETEQKPPKPVKESKPSLSVEADIPGKINLPGTQPKTVEQEQHSLAVEADIPDKINLQENSAAEMLEKAGINTLFPNGLPEGVTVQTININGTPTLIFKKDGQNLDMAQLKELVNSQQLQQAEEPVKPVTTSPSEGENPVYDNAVKPNSAPILSEEQFSKMVDELIDVNDCRGSDLDTSLAIAEKYSSILDNTLTPEQQSKADALYQKFLDSPISSFEDGALGISYKKGGFVMNSPDDAEKIKPIARNLSKVLVASQDKYEELLNGKDYNTVIQDVADGKLKFNQSDWSLILGHNFLAGTLLGESGNTVPD